jgi:hypothetical protein
LAILGGTAEVFSVVSFQRGGGALEEVLLGAEDGKHQGAFNTLFKSKNTI